MLSFKTCLYLKNIGIKGSLKFDSIFNRLFVFIYLNFPEFTTFDNANAKKPTFSNKTSQ